jgi:hypothetical protein
MILPGPRLATCAQSLHLEDLHLHHTSIPHGSSNGGTSGTSGGGCAGKSHADPHQQGSASFTRPSPRATASTGALQPGAPGAHEAFRAAAPNTEAGAIGVSKAPTSKPSSFKGPSTHGGSGKGSTHQQQQHSVAAAWSWRDHHRGSKGSIGSPALAGSNVSSSIVAASHAADEPVGQAGAATPPRPARTLEEHLHARRVASATRRRNRSGLGDVSPPLPSSSTSVGTQVSAGMLDSRAAPPRVLVNAALPNVPDSCAAPDTHSPPRLAASPHSHLLPLVMHPPPARTSRSPLRLASPRLAATAAAAHEPKLADAGRSVPARAQTLVHGAHRTR